jgi:hypothetical protein
MSEDHTTAVVQRYLDELAQDSPAEPIVRALSGPSRPQAPPALRHDALPELSAVGASAAELASRGIAQRRDGTVTEGHARSTLAKRAPILRPSQPAGSGIWSFAMRSGRRSVW